MILCWNKTNLFKAFAFGFAITLSQILICLALSAIPFGSHPYRGPLDAYQGFNQWDSYHYMDISRGYQMPLGQVTSDDIHSMRANPCFFPAYPFIVKTLQSLTSIPISYATLVASQFFCLCFWVQWFLLLSLWQIPPKLIYQSAVTVALFPTSFFLVMGYSESLYMASLLGLILWTELWLLATQAKRLSVAWLLAGVCGTVLSATRLVGLLLASYPFIRLWALSHKPLKKQILYSFLLSSISSLGGCGFFLYCYFRFHEWNIYFRLQKIGWQIYANYFAPFFPSSYLPKLFFEDTHYSVCKLLNLVILSLFILFGLHYWKEWKTQRSLNRNNLALIFSAFIMFYICISGMANSNMVSMSRYNLPIFALLVLSFTRTLADQKTSFQPLLHHWASLSERRIHVIVTWISIIAIFLQIIMICNFTKGGWVA